MLDLCAVRKIQTAVRLLEKELRIHTALSLNDALCLCSVKHGICEPGLLAREMDLSPSRLSRILDSLEQRGLVERTVATGDRRAITVQLTSKAIHLIEQYQCADMELPAELQWILKN